MVLIATSEHSAQHDISDMARMRIGRELLGERLRNNVTEDPSEIHKIVMEGTVDAYRAFGVELPKERPNFLIHMMQVNMVTASLMDGIRHKPDGTTYEGKERRKLKKQAAMYAGIHDIGRILDIPDLPHVKRSDQHAINGRALLGEFLPGEIKYGQGNYARFAYGHHNWGLYMEFASPHPAIEIIHRGRNDARDRALAEGITDQNELDSVVNLGQDIAIDRVISLYDQEFGIAGMAAIIADLSKAYLDPDDIHRSVIDGLTEEKGKALIERQISFGSYERHSDRYINEIIGLRFMTRLISYIHEAYGVDYQKAIEDAKEKWDGYVIDSLNREWKELTTSSAENVAA